MIELEKLNVRLGTWSQRLAPGYSWCRRCETPWLFVHHHDTTYRPGYGLIALCRKCWTELSPEQRLPFYRQVWEHWQEIGRTDDEEWEAIKAAVLEGQ